MATIADNLLSLAGTKAKTKRNLLYSGKDASGINSFDGLIDLAFSDDFDNPDAPFLPDPSWAQDLSTWTPEGGIGLIVSDFGLGKTSFIVDTDGEQYTVVVNDGTNDISTNSYASGAQCDISMTPGDGTVTNAVKITSASPIRRFRIVRSTGVIVNQHASLLYFYGKLASLNNCANMFFLASTCRCSQLLSVHIDNTSLVTNMSYMFNACTSLRAVPAVMDTSLVTNMSYMFNACYSLRAVPAVMDTSLVTNMGYMFNSCYSLRVVPAVMDTSLVTNMSYMFNACYSLRAVPEVMDTSKVTNMSYMFNACYSLRAVPAVMDTSKVTDMSYMFGYCTSLRAVPAVMNTSLATNMSSMFNSCYSLRAVPAVMDTSKVTDMSSFGTAMRSLSRGLLDLSAAVITTRLQITEAQGLKGLLVSSSGTWTGAAPQIEITDCGLARTALVALFNSLGTISGKTVKVTGNPGTADLTAADIKIATDKGWTVTTT